jgi:two-component system sensor kinase FixL
MTPSSRKPQKPAVSRIEAFQRKLGPFVVAAETTRIAMIFTDGPDVDNAIVFANDAVLALTGFTREALIGLPLNALLRDVSAVTSGQEIRSALSEGGSGCWELKCSRADGSDFLAAVFLRSVQDKDGTVRQNVLSFVDIPDPPGQSVGQGRHFHALYELTPGFIAITDGPDHRFTFANVSYERFVGRKIVIGQTVAEALPEIPAQGFVDLLDQVYRTGKPYVGRGIPVSIADTSNGAANTRYCDFVYQAVRDADNVITGIFCEGYDVTDQRQASDALSALQSELIHVARVNAMGTMAATLAHELNQPLSAIANYAAGARHVGLDAPDGEDRLDQALQGIEEATQRAAEIIRNLRELTRRKAPVRVAFDLKRAVGECLRLVRATAPLSIDFRDTVPDHLMMSADRVQIQQVIINLLRNACDALSGASHKEVCIDASRDDGAVVVSVTDTGPGVSPDAAGDIFSWSDSRKEGGMGLGLSICRTILEAHRGRIWLQNSGDDGSTFCFSVPQLS